MGEESPSKKKKKKRQFGRRKEGRKTNRSPIPRGEGRNSNEKKKRNDLVRRGTGVRGILASTTRSTMHCLARSTKKRGRTKKA